MPYVLAPAAVSSREALVWIGGINENPAGARLELAHPGGTEPLGGAWDRWASRNGQYSLDHRRFPLRGLAPGNAYALELRVNGQARASATVMTLPERLPTAGQRPFTVLLGSCFCVAKDGAGRVGNTFFHLPAGARPDVKILCGDQVYLDSPWTHYLFATHSPEELEAEFFENYFRTWTQRGPASGFQLLLESGANYFASDDHEFWNNAPNKGAYVADTWLPGGSRRWLEVAGGLFRRFQTDATIARFEVSPLSFCIADTRVNRSTDRTQFMTPAELGQVEQWLASLPGPGVLVLGQPVLTGKTGIRGHLGDWGLADFDQYTPLVRALHAARHSIVVLTGDVHFGRVASCRLPLGCDLIEVVSSPMALVDSKAKGKWGPAPALFPVFDIPGVRKVPVRTEDFSSTQDHFLTLEFSAVGGRVRMVVKAWSILGRVDPSPG